MAESGINIVQLKQLINANKRIAEALTSNFRTIKLSDADSSAVVTVDATGQGDVPITLDSEIVVADVTGQGDVPVTLDGEVVILGAGTAEVGNVKISDGTDQADVETLSDGSHDIDGLKGLVTAANIYGRVDDDTVKPVLISPSHQIIVVTDIEHEEIHEGDHYFVRSYQDLTINQVLDFTLLTPNTTKWLNFTWQLDVEAETLWQVYRGATATNPLANAITPINSNENSANTSGATLKYEVQANLAAANADTDVSGATLIESGIAGAFRASGSSNRSHEIILKQNTLYCFRATATVAGFINFNMQWYEHTAKN